MSSELTQLLATAGHRATKPRLRVFTTLQQQTQPRTIRELAALCPQTDRVSIYRTVELFVSLGIASVVPLGWKQRYELAEPFKAHHHHLHCDSCGALEDIQSDEFEALIQHIASNHDFCITRHTFELHGICARCRS